MNRIVYLFELDSVRKFDIKDDNTIYMSDGVRMLFDEIIINGNTVAISMNQLTDSQFFAQAVNDDFAYPILCELFELGALRVSLYGNLRTASQYIQQSIGKCLRNNDDSFVFSNLSVSYNEKCLLKEIRTALRYSDLSKLQARCDESTGEEKKRYEYICRFISMILKLSINETSNIPAKKPSTKNFEFFLEKITDILSKYTFQDKRFDKQIKNAILEISNRSLLVTEQRNNRSNWLYFKDGQKALSHVASEIINLSYNYTIEESINGVSKHYDDINFEQSFANDLIMRTESYCNPSVYRQWKPLPKRIWSRALRFAEYRNFSLSIVTKRYEDSFSTEQIKWKFHVLFKAMMSFAIAILYIGLFVATELLLQVLEEHFNFTIGNALLSSAVKILIVGSISSLSSNILSRFTKIEIPDILKSVSDLILHGFDAIFILTGGIYEKFKQSFRLFSVNKKLS